MHELNDWTYISMVHVSDFRSAILVLLPDEATALYVACTANIPCALQDVPCKMLACESVMLAAGRATKLECAALPAAHNNNTAC